MYQDINFKIRFYCFSQFLIFTLYRYVLLSKISHIRKEINYSMTPSIGYRLIFFELIYTREFKSLKVFVCSNKKITNGWGWGGSLNFLMQGTIPNVGNMAQPPLRKVEKPVGSEVGGQDPCPWIGSPVGNQACIVPRLL